MMIDDTTTRQQRSSSLSSGGAVGGARRRRRARLLVPCFLCCAGSAPRQDYEELLQRANAPTTSRIVTAAFWLARPTRLLVLGDHRRHELVNLL